MVQLLLVGLLLGDVAPRRPPTPNACSSDDECTISTSAGCCACCPTRPFATTKKDALRAAAQCDAVRCAACGEQECSSTAPASDFRAMCLDGQCIPLLRSAPPAPEPECRADSDCTTVLSQPPAGDACYSSNCGCCPVLRPAPVKTSKRAPAPPPTEQPAKRDSPFGLSTGKPAPSCAPCPAPAPRRAACSSENRCIVVPVPRPHQVGRR